MTRNDALLTPREERLAAELLTAPSISEAGRRAGYSEGSVRSGSWYRRVAAKIRPLTLAHLARKGVTLPKVSEKMAEFLEAKKVVAVRVVGEEQRESVTVPDYEIQIRTAENYYKILRVLGTVPGDRPEEGEPGKIIELHMHFSGKAPRDGRGNSPFRFEVETRR